MASELHEMIDSNLTILSHLGICMFERLLDSIIERINLCLGGEFTPELIRSLSLPQDENIINIKKKMVKPVITVVYGPGFATPDSSNLIDLLRNSSDDFLSSVFITELLENSEQIDIIIIIIFIIIIRIHEFETTDLLYHYMAIYRICYHSCHYFNLSFIRRLRRGILLVDLTLIDSIINYHIS